FQVRAPPPLKRQRLEVPAREARMKAREAVISQRREAWAAIKKLFASKKDVFEAGRNGLQSYRARAIESCLQMMLKNGRNLTSASERAAESQGFSPIWGARMVRSWVGRWITSRDLLTSKRGKYSKVFSLLDDLLVCTELRTYLRSNKWSMNPKKLVEFTKNKLLPDEAKKYLQHVVETEMPNGLKKYQELELFPQIQMKVSKGISLRTAHPHDREKMSWVWQGEQPLKKKGAGRGLHQSDFICSTVGWLKEASKTLEYGKNYDGFWNGELFIKQLREDFVPAFRKAHGPDYQALVMVDNSQGHSAYSVDALVASQMNMNPGGKQPNMRNGWYVKDGIRVSQDMNFSSTHPNHPGQPKAVKKYLRENCDYTYKTLQENMPTALASVSLQTIRRWEHRMDRWVAAYDTGLDAKEAQ
ncbi:hypothetical protein M422DRAFT_169742, partial [Sphaerobolus stellatus SS14]